MIDTIFHGLLILAMYVFLPMALFSMALGLMSRGRIDELAYLKGIADGMGALFGFLLGMCETVSDVLWEKIRGRQPRTYATAGERAVQRAFKVSIQYALAIALTLGGLFLLGSLAGERRTAHCPPDAPVYKPDPRIN